MKKEHKIGAILDDMEVQIGSIVQITDEDHAWFPALIIVTELKDFGIQGYCNMPSNDRNGGNAYIRLKKSVYELVGKAKIVAA